jgi:hypothetical protein
MRKCSLIITVVASTLCAFSSATVSESTVFTFSSSVSGAGPGPLIFDSEGNLYGALATTPGKPVGCGPQQYNCGSVFELKHNSNGTWIESILYSFTGSASGANPSGLVFDGPNVLYVTTYGDGPQDLCSFQCGSVIKLTRNFKGAWIEKTLYTFTGGSDGGNPTGAVVLDKHGNLYGVASAGGDLTCSGDRYGCGVAFELSPTTSGPWKETILHTFGTTSTDGELPLGPLIFDKIGNLYGVGSYGGSTGYAGTAFELSLVNGAWTETTLYSFQGGTDGLSPNGGLIFDPKGDLYGTTPLGGEDEGTVFKLIPGIGGWSEQVLYRFQPNVTDGNNPRNPVLMNSAGDIFGTTAIGGGTNTEECNGTGCGTVFELTPSISGTWSESILFSFDGTDGSGPGQLVSDKSGNIYGPANAGSDDSGIIFKVTQ